MCSLLDYAEKKGIEKGVQALIEAGLAFGQDYDSTMKMVMEKYSVDAETAREKMKCYWKGV